MSPRVSSRRFIGRRSELERLDAALTASRSAEPLFLVVGGEAGVGKTRLVDEAAQRARESGHTVLVGGCLNVSEDAAPLAPFVEALRTLVGALSPTDLEVVIGPASEVIGLILPDAGLRQEPARESGSQSRLFEHVLGIFARLSARTPTLLVIEDIHWADRSTLDLLRFLARNLHAGAMVVIATHRTDEPVARVEVRSFLSEMDRSGRVERLELRSFNRAELADQLQGIQGSPASGDLVDRIHRLSDGNAFHAEELAAAEAVGLGLPETLEQVILARIDGLSGAGRALLGIASVTGAQTTERLLLAVAEEDDRTVRAALHELLERKLLVRRRRGTAEAIEFRHALLQEVVYARLLPEERARLHEACACYLEGELSEAPSLGLLTELARHWSEVGDADRALRASLRAGTAADEAYAPSEAALQYQRVLHLWSLAPTAVAEIGLDRVELLERTARVESTGSSAKAIGHIDEAIRLVDPAADPVRAGLLHERLGRYRWINTDGAGAMEAYLTAMRLVPADPPSAARARVTASLGQILMILARYEDSLPLCEEALAAARAAGARDVEANALCTLGVDVAYLGDVDRGLAMFRESLAVAREIGSVEDVARAYTSLVDISVIARFDDAMAIAQEAFEYSDGHGLTALYGIGALTYAAWAAYRWGQWAESARYLDSARLHPADTLVEITILTFAAFLQVGTGAFELARSGLERARVMLERSIDTEDIAPYTEARAELALWTADPAAASRVIAAGIERVEPPTGANISRIGPLYALGVRAAADRLATGRTGRDPERPEVLRLEGQRYVELMSEAHARNVSRWPPHASLSLPYLRLCEAEGTRLGERADPSAWDSAADELANLGLRYPSAYARWRQGEAILASGRGKAAARAPLREAAETAIDLGAEPLRAAVGRVAERAGLEISASSAGGEEPAARRFGLTRREMEVLRLLVDGRTNRQIAGALFIGEKTAGTHVSSILGKLEVASRTEAASLAHREGLVDDGGLPPDG